MSHEVHSRPNLKDLKKVCQAFAKFGWEIKENAACRGLVGKHKLVAVNPVKSYGYDIAIVEDKSGVHFSHESMLNWTETFGQDWGRLKQEYSRLQVIEEVESRYGTCETQVLRDGTIEMEIEVEVTI